MSGQCQASMRVIIIRIINKPGMSHGFPLSCFGNRGCGVVHRHPSIKVTLVQYYEDHACLVSRHKQLERAYFGRQSLAHVPANLGEMLGGRLGHICAVSLERAVMEAVTDQLHHFGARNNMQLQIAVNYTGTSLYCV
jgi:hypothetical protein